MTISGGGSGGMRAGTLKYNLYSKSEIKIKEPEPVFKHFNLKITAGSGRLRFTIYAINTIFTLLRPHDIILERIPPSIIG